MGHGKSNCRSRHFFFFARATISQALNGFIFKIKAKQVFDFPALSLAKSGVLTAIAAACVTCGAGWLSPITTDLRPFSDNSFTLLPLPTKVSNSP